MPTIAIEEVSPGVVLDQEIMDLTRETVVYKPGIRLTAEIINNILSLEYLEINIKEFSGTETNENSVNIPVKSYKSGEFICFQGEPAGHIYMLQKGVIQVIATETNPPIDDLEKAKQFVQKHGKVISQIRGKNTKFGEMAGILNGLRSASIRCNTDVNVVEISTNESAFKKTLLYNPKLGLSIASTMAQRLLGVRRAIVQIHKYYALLSNKINIYQAAFEKIKGSITKKSESQLKEWLQKLVHELKNISPLSDYQKFKPKNVKRIGEPYPLQEQILPPEYESNIPINSYLTVAGKSQESFFILRKGKVEAPIGESGVKLYREPGLILEGVHPIADGKNYNGSHKEELRSITPVRLYKIPVKDFERISAENPPVILFICKWIANELTIDDQYMLNLLEAFEKDLSSLAIGDTNYRRAYKKLHRLLEKFSKDPALTKTELALAASLRQQIDKDYALLKDGINQVHLNKQS
tara:strand:+ start:6997 stop:8400 length:1404 start_codon:yes stop_codon:yes gene_type:complete